MSNINKINGLDIDAASAQYVAAGNVDGPQGYNSVQNSNTASLALAVSTTNATLDTHSIALLVGGTNAPSVYNSSGTGLLFNANTQRLSVPQLAAVGITGSLSGSISSATTAATASIALRVSSSNTGIGDTTDYRVALFATNSQNLIRTSGVNISYTPDPGRLSVPQITATGITGSFNGSITNATSASFAATASYVNTLNQNLTINGNLSVFGTASYTYVSASQLDVGTNTISVNVAEPAERFGGLIVYDSGSLSHQATASFLWDSEKNKWIYQNVSGSGYDGGMAIFGPRNTAGLGNEQGTTNNAIMKGQGGDHITSSRIFDDGTNVYTNSNVQITGSLTVTGNVIATASWASNAITAQSSSINYLIDGGSYPLVYTNNSTGNQPLGISPYGAVYNSAVNSISNISSITASSGFQGTASYAIQALTASYAMNGGGGGGVTSIIAGDGISVDQPTGAVTITNTGGGGGGTNLGLVYAVSLGYLMP